MRVANFIPLFLLVFGCAQTLTPPPCTEEVNPAEIAAVPADQLQIDLDIIDDTLDARGITPLIDPTGIRYTIQQVGTGNNIPCLQSQVILKYTGILLSPGSNQLIENQQGIFDEKITPIQLAALRVLGLKVMLKQFKVGTKATLFIPSGFAYGPSSLPADLGSGKSSIPANGNLVFEIELLAVQ